MRKPGDLQRRILPSRGLDQAVQHGVVEQLGPETQVGLCLLLRLADLAIQVGLPLVEPGDLGFLEIRTDSDAGTQCQRGSEYWPMQQCISI